MGKKPQIAVLLANTGTPDDPSPEAVRRYLRDYLKDRRIVEMPPFIWLPILYGTVATVFQKGWMIQERVLRPAMVAVAQG